MASSARSAKRYALHDGASAATRWPIFLPSFLGTRSAASTRWKPSTNDSAPLQCLSWRKFLRDQLPARSTLARFLAALTEAPVEALRTLFLDDVLRCPLSTESNEKQTGSLMDREGNAWVVFDIDGTRQAARQRA